MEADSPEHALLRAKHAGLSCGYGLGRTHYQVYPGEDGCYSPEECVLDVTDEDPVAVLSRG